MASRLGTLISFALAHAVNAAVSASTPLPPLQWISLSSLTSGSSPPPLKDASIGYNAVSRTLLIFGGESESGVAQSATYLLNLDTLTWAQPTPPAGIGSTPPARSAAVSGDDFAASYRTGHLVVGGKGTNGAFLTDIWEFDYNNQFWAQVNVGSGGPSVIIPGGGIDNINVFFEMNDSLPTNSFYAFGGSSSPVSLSDAWELQIAGALAPNIQQGLTATWISRKFSGSRPAMAGQGGTVNHRKLISFGGCVGTANPNISCVTGNATIVDIASGSVVTVPPCAAPRLGPAVVSNRSPFTSSFETQAFAFLGTFNTSLWNDGGGLQRGEVDILDFAAATWTRVLPADDPSGGVPSPREGAAALSFNEGLVGTSRAGYSDTIVFGGKNASGTYFNDLWILRAYNGSVSSSGARWSGYGNGNLQSGINANGQGVTMQFLSSCATAIASAPTAPGSSTAPFPTATDPSTSPSSAPVLTSGVHPYDTATSHKVLAPISVALFPLGIIFLRLSQPTAHSTAVGDRSLGLRTLSRAIFAVAFGSGLAGLILSFTTIVASPSSTSKIAKRAVSSDNILRTTHGQAGIALFVLLYVVLPILAIGYSVVRRVHKRLSGEDAADDAMLKNGERAESVDAVEKLNGGSSGAASPNPHPYDRSAVTTPAIEAPIPASPRRRHRSLTSSSFITSLLPTAERRSNESIALSEPTAPSGPPSTNPHSFEVVNRPPRRRHLSATEGPMSDSSHRTFTGQPRRSLSDISWLDRRRSVNAVNEIDYALMQLHQRGPATPATELSSNALMKPGERPADIRLPTMPPAAHTLFSFLANLLILALSVHSLVALWERAPRAAFVVFLIWIVVLYVAIVVLAWYGRPRHSALAVVLSRLRGDYTHTQPYDAAAVTPNESRPMSPAGPYLHQPLFRAAATEEEYGSATRMANGARAAEDEVDSDEDEDTRQRRIEDEMQRRDVSIVTVPKRRLWITNPS